LNEYFLDEQQFRRKERSFTMRRKKDGCWRYQAVYIEREIGENEKVKEYSICEIYLDKDEKLEMWTENPSIAPYGLSYDELIGSLHLMLEDVEIDFSILYHFSFFVMYREKTEPVLCCSILLSQIQADKRLILKRI
jgi:hypothetical protein